MIDNDASLIPAPDSEVPPTLVTVRPEAVVVVDVVESTFATNLFGWYAVGRGLMSELRSAIKTIGTAHNLRCMKSTGDGYLLTYGDAKAAEIGAIHAVDASAKLIEYLIARNRDPRVPEERCMGVRIAIHFGQVDVVENDREGPHVSYVFRLEAVNRESLRDALNPVPATDLPLRNYILLSEPVRDILDRRAYHISPIPLGLFRFKGFPDWHEVFLYAPP